jgi:uncharacterized protein YgiM (DUF1202 family)
MKHLLILMFLSFSFITAAQSSHNLAENSGGRCTGSSSCTACKNCSRCAHCSNGGSCGVCARGVSRPATTPQRNSNYQGNSIKSPAKYQKPTTAVAIGGIYSVSSNTLNMRKGPGSDYAIVHVLKIGDKIEVVEPPKNGCVKVGHNYYEKGLKKTVLGYVSTKYLSI